MSSNYLTQVMLCEYFNCKMVVKYIYIRMSPYRIYQADLNLSTCIIFMMKNTEFGMSTLLMKIEVTFIILIKIHAPVNKLSDLKIGRASCRERVEISVVAESLKKKHGQ